METAATPQLVVDNARPGRVHLRGSWTLDHALALAERLREAPADLSEVDARDVDALDSLGVLQLMRFASRRSVDFSCFRFNDRHRALIRAIEDVSDTRTPARRDYGVSAALGRLGETVVEYGREAMALVGFLGEVLAKLLRLARDPGRLRVTATVFHMEQVGLDAAPLVALLCYLVGAVIAFLGANILRDFGATIYVVELVNISFLREFAVLLTAIILAGRTASAFTAQIGAMKSREEVDAIRTLGLDPVDLLVIPRVLALVAMLPLLTFIGMMFGLLGGLTVGAYGLDIPPEQYLTRMRDTMEVRHFVVGLVKAPFFAMVIALIGCLEGLQVQGTAQSVGERTTSSVVQTISLVIVLDALAAIWFMEVGY